ncbi:hypothetical protein ES705_33440 [subsurface metagenome]
MAKKSFEFDTRYSDIEQSLEERKSRIKTICFKTCSKCGETKFIFKFSLDKRNTDGRTNVCKNCRVSEAEKYYYKNKDRILIRNKIYRDNNRRDRSEYFKKYQEENKERLKRLAKKWYKKNRKTIKKRNLEYYRANEEACKQRRKLWIEKNKEGVKKYNREYKRKHKILRAVI